MPSLVILFHDGEIMCATSPPLLFDLPVIEADVTDLGSNTERAILPLAAIRQIIVGDAGTAPAPEDMEGWDRAAFHFSDGQVLRAWVGPDAVLGVHGGIWPVVEPGSDELRTLAIPYTSLKGVFRLRAWDTRSAAERATKESGDSAALDQTVRILAERELRSLGAPDRRGTTLLARLRADGLERALAAGGETRQTADGGAPERNGDA
jgi:hypothetical protein